MYIPVATIDGKQAFFLELKETSHILSFNRKIEVFTNPDHYFYLVNVISELGKAAEGREFLLVNQNTMINLENIIKYDRLRNTVYFRSGDQVLNAIVSTKNVPKLNGYLKKAKGVGHN